jgi:cyclohexanecarboxyl-CoA dehydrogenase
VLIELSDEQVAVRDLCRRFGTEEIAPVRHELDRSPETYRELARRLAKLGLLEIIDIDANGVDRTAPAAYVTIGVAAEELGRFDTSLAQVVTGALTRLPRLGKLADRALAARIRADFVSGDAVICGGLTESEAGSDIQGLRTTARRVPGGVRITGEKNSVSELPSADWIAILAREIDTDGTALGFTQFMVPIDAPGLSRSYLDDMGWRGRGRGIVSLDDVFAPDGQRVGETGAGLTVNTGALDCNRAALALACIGAARASVDETVAYTSLRQAFGRPLAANQAVSFALVDAATKLDAARWMCYRVLELRGRGLPHGAEAAMAKWWGTQVAIDAIRDCIRFTGHTGYSSEAPLEQRLRDVIGFEIAEGPTEVMKLTVARKMFGREITG